MISIIIFSQLIFASPCPKYNTAIDAGTTISKSCSSLEDVVNVSGEIKSEKECKPYKESNCFGFYEKSFSGYINGEAKNDQKKNAEAIIKSKANNAISSILITLLSEGTKYDDKLNSLSACSLGELNKVPEGCKNKLEAFGLSPQKLSQTYGQNLSDKNDNNISCGLGINHYQSLMTMANDKELHKRFSDFFKTDNGIELKKLINESKTEDVNQIVKIYFSKLAPAQKLKNKSLISLINNNPKAESLFSHREDIDGFIAEGFSNKKFEEHYLAAINNKCAKSFKAIKETVCGIKTEQDYTISDPALLKSDLEQDKIITTHMFCRTEQKVNIDNLSSLSQKDAPSFSIFMDQKRTEIKNQMEDLCKIKIGCNDNSFNCWRSGCSKNDLNPNQKNYCDLLGAKNGDDFQISSPEVIALLKDPNPESSNKNQSELLKYFLDPKPQISTYIAEAKKNEGENKKIAANNTDERGMMGATPKSSTNQNIAGGYSDTSNQQRMNPTSSQTQSMTGAPPSSTTVHNNQKKQEVARDNAPSNSITDETKELDGIQNAHNEVSNRLANTPTLPKNEKNSQKVEPKVNDAAQVPTTTASTSVEKKEEIKKTPRDERSTASQTTGLKNKISGMNSPFSGDSTKDIASTIRRDLKKAEINDKKIAATIKVKHLYLDEHHIQDIQKEIIGTFGSELKNGRVFELTLEDVNHTYKKVSLTFIPRPVHQNGHWEYEYDVTSLENTPETLALLTHFNKSKLLIPFEVVEKKPVLNEKRARAEELNKNL
jgi:hypothetical protein